MSDYSLDEFIPEDVDDKSKSPSPKKDIKKVQSPEKKKLDQSPPKPVDQSQYIKKQEPDPVKKPEPVSSFQQQQQDQQQEPQQEEVFVPKLRQRGTLRQQQQQKRQSQISSNNNLSSNNDLNKSKEQQQQEKQQSQQQLQTQNSRDSQRLSSQNSLLQSQIAQKQVYQKQVQRDFKFDRYVHSDIEVIDQDTIKVKYLAQYTEAKFALVEPALDINKKYVLTFKIKQIGSINPQVAVGITNNKSFISQDKYQFNNPKSSDNGAYMIQHDRNVYTQNNILDNDTKACSFTFKEGDTINLTVNPSGKLIFKNDNTSQEYEMEFKKPQDASINPFYPCVILKNDNDSVQFIQGKEVENDNIINQSQLYQSQQFSVILQECFVYMKDLFRSKRINLYRDFKSKEQNINFLVLKTGITEERQEELKQIRKTCWRGYIKKDDFFEVMKKYEFLKHSEHEVLEMLIKMVCYNPKYKYVHYVKLFSVFYTKSSQYSQQQQKFMPSPKNKILSKYRNLKCLPEEKIKIWYKDQKEAKKEFQKKQRSRQLNMKYRGGSSMQNKDKEEVEKKNENLLDSMRRSSDNVVLVLKERISSSQISLEKIFKSFDVNGDGYISLKEFLKAFNQANIEIEENVLIQAYKKFDKNNDEKVSYSEFLETLLGQEKDKTVFNYLREAEDIINQIRKYMKGAYDNLSDFIEAVEKNVKDAQMIRQFEFTEFVNRHTKKQFSDIQLRNVFNFLNKDEVQLHMETLTLRQMSEIYQHEVKKQELNQDKLKEQLDKKKNEEYKLEYEKQENLRQEEQDLKYAKKVFESTQQENIKDYKSLADKKVVDLFAKSKTNLDEKDEEEQKKLSIKKKIEAQRRTQIYKEELDYMEQILQAISQQVQLQLKQRNKSLRDLFNMFTTKEFFGYIDLEGYLQMMTFVLGAQMQSQQEYEDSFQKYSSSKKKVGFSDELIKSVFYIFSNDLTKRMSFNLFKHLIETADNINPLYLKFKKRFGNTLESKREVIEQDFQRLDVIRGDGFIKLSDFQDLLQENNIEFDKKDAGMLQDKGMLKTMNGQLYVNYQSLLPQIFPQNQQIQQEIFNKHTRIILRCFRMFRQRREQKKKDQLKQQQQQNQKQQGGRLGKSQKKVSIITPPEMSQKQGQSKMGSQQFSSSSREKSKSDLQQLGDIMKPSKELFELMEDHNKPQQKSNRDSFSQQLSSARQSLKKGAKKPSKSFISKKDMGSQLNTLLSGQKQEDKFAKEKRNVVEKFCYKILDNILDKVVVFGESQQLSKQIQKKYERRPVRKDVYITLQDFEVNVTDTHPKSLYASEQTGRVMYVDGQSYLHQYDFANQQKLKSIYVGSKVPLKRTKILDQVFDNHSGRLYILNDKWTVEVWEIGQGQSVPIARIRLFSEEHPSQQIIDSCYPRRFNNTSPNFLIISDGGHNSVLVNCTCVNNTVVFIDPLSLSIYNTLYFSPSDYKMSSNLAKLTQIMAPKLLELKNKNIGFEEIFEGKFKTSHEGKTVSVDDCTHMLKIVFGDQNNHPEITTQEWEEVSQFLDQNNSGQIDQVEFEFLNDLFKFIQPKSEQNSGNQNFQKLQGLSQQGIQMLNELSDYLKTMKLSVYDAFSIFDSDGSGQISVHEFEQILDRVVGSGKSHETKIELIEFIDQDKSGTIDIQEFAEVFGVASDPQNIKQFQANSRKNIMICFSKCFAGGINIEQLLLDQDPQREGIIKAKNFKNLLKWLPLGLLEDEIEHIMRNQVSYTDCGSIDYLKFVKNMQFKEMKFSYQMKKSLLSAKDFDKFHDNIDQDKRHTTLQNQKVIVESIIFLDDFDLIIYTTLCPKTSLIFVSQSKKNNDPNLKKQSNKPTTTSQQKIDSDIFENKLLAKLDGHATTNPPAIYFCKESGFLISGEKVDQIKGFHPSNKQDIFHNDGSKKDNFSQYYKNLEHKAINQPASIIIWDIQNSLQTLYDTNPPWKIIPTKIIENAHNSSIIDITYLPFSQLIATTSTDKTVKLWDPTARPYSLTAPSSSQQGTRMIKPGYYQQGEGECQQTLSNQPFCLVRTIYTGNNTCHSLQNLVKKVPIEQHQIDLKAPKKFQILEILFCMNLSEPQLMQGHYKSQGSLKGYSIDKMQIEIPGKIHDEIIPKKYQDELEELAIERKKKTYINYQLNLPMQLESLKSNNRVQQTELNKALQLLKSLNLYQYDYDAGSIEIDSHENQGGEQDKFNFKNEAEKLFKILVNLPSRKAFHNLVGNSMQNAQDKKLTANEVFYFLKKFHNIHPLTLTREKFFHQILLIKNNLLQENQYLQQEANQNQLEKNLGELFRIKGLKIHEELEDCESAKEIEANKLTPKDIIITRSDFREKLKELKIFTSDEDFVELVLKLDPLFTNWISSNFIEQLYSSQIISNKLQNIKKPEQIAKQIMEQLSPKQKTMLMNELSMQDTSCDGYLSQQEFKKAFENCDLTVDYRLLDEIFEILAEKFDENDFQKVLSFKIITTTFFNQQENLAMTKNMHILGKIKRTLLDRGKKMDYPFLDINPKTHQPQGVPFFEISEQIFIDRLYGLGLSNISKEELIHIANFLAISSIKQKKLQHNREQQVITYAKFQHYLRKIHTKDRYLLVSDYQKLYNEVRAIVKQAEKYKALCKQYFQVDKYQQQNDENDNNNVNNNISQHYSTKIIRQLKHPDIRYVLTQMNIHTDQIDDIILRFVQNKESVSHEEFLEILVNFQQEFDGLKPVKKQIEDEEVQSLNQSSKNNNNQGQEDQGNKEENKEMLQNILFFKSKDNEAQVKEMYVRENKYTQQLVDYLRQEQPIAIEILRDLWRAQDLEKTGEIEIVTFSNILQNNVENISENLVINFQKEFLNYNSTTMIEYQDFLDKYLTDGKKDKENNKKQLSRSASQDAMVDLKNINQILKQITQKVDQNISFIVRYYSDRDGHILTRELIEHFKKMKIDLEQTQIEEFQAYFQPPKTQEEKEEEQYMSKEELQQKNQRKKIDGQKFLEAIYVSKQNLSVSFNEKIWMIYAPKCGIESLETSYTNKSFIKFLIEKESEKFYKENPSQKLKFPLVKANIFYNAIASIRDFRGKQSDRITVYAIIGSSSNEEEGFKKLLMIEQSSQSHGESIYSNFIVNLELFIQSLEVIINILNEEDQKKGINSNTDRNINNNKRQLQEITEEQEDLIREVNRNLKDQNVSLWDALLSTDIRLTEETTVPIREFKSILNSLNMELSLKQKLLLIKLADPEQTRKCNIELFIKKIDSNPQLSKTAVQTILDKFATALFYNDMSISQAFKCFDIDNDGDISKNEFIYGMQQLDMGLSIFEINQINDMLDLDKNGHISKEEFQKIIQKYNLDNNIDPLKDFSLSLLAKIKNLITLKGADLMQSCQEIDETHKGYLTYEELKAALRHFGINNLKNYQALTLYKIYKSKKVQNLQFNNQNNNNTEGHNNALSQSKYGGGGVLSRQQSGMAKSHSSSQQGQQQNNWISSDEFDGKNAESVQYQEVVNDKIRIREFVHKVLEAVNIHAKSAIDSNNELFRKVAKLLKMKKISLFEAFLYMDINNTGQLSKLELTVGFQNLQIPLNDMDLKVLWKAFDKTQNNRVSFPAFFQKFVQSGAISLIAFDNTLDTLLKNFSSIVNKFGNYSDAFSKFDVNNNGEVSLSEFRTVAKKYQLGFNQSEVDLIFKSLINADALHSANKFQIQQDDMEKSNQQQQSKYFSYRQFVRLMNQFSQKSITEVGFYKLCKATQDQKINWKQEILNHNKKFDPKTKDPSSIFIRNFLDLLKRSKLPITEEEIKSIVNSFDQLYVNSSLLNKKMQQAANKFDDTEKQKSQMIHGLILRIQENMEKIQITLERLFQQFDANQNGTMTLKELTHLIQFLNINVNKNQIKIFFKALDVDRKEYFTISEFRSFLEESAFIRTGKQKDTASMTTQEREDVARMADISEKIRESLKQQNSTLSNVIYEMNLDEQTALNAKNLEQFLFQLKISLKKQDIQFVIDRITAHLQYGAQGENHFLTYQNFLDFAIRENIEQIQYDESVNYIHPIVAMCVEKISLLFKKLGIDTKKGFKYFVKPGRDYIKRNAFLKIIQSLDLNFTGDDLELIYSYFDDKRHGEIAQELFIEKFDYLANMGLNKLREQNSQEIEQKEGDGTADQMKIMKLSSKVQVQAIMQKIFFFMQEKRYNKKQMKSLFDKNGNGILSREEFMEALSYLQLGIPVVKARMVLDYLDKNETGEIDVDEVIKTIFQSIPQAYKQAHSHSGLVKIFSSLIQKIKKETQKLLEDMIEYEKEVRPDFQTQQYSTQIQKAKPGLHQLDFSKILRKLGVKLNEEEREEIKSVFAIRMNPEYLDLEQLYDMIEELYFEQLKSSQASNSLLDSENLSQLWEQKQYRKMGNYLRKHNMTVEQAFHHIDQDNSGLINLQEFKKFISSCQLELSEKEVNSLVASYIQSDGLISFQNFKNKFWEAYTCYGRSQGVEDNIKHDIQQLVQEQKKALVYVFMVLREKSHSSLEKAWSLLDVQKQGSFNIENYRQALVQCGVYLSKSELSFTFNFVNKSQSNVVNFFEFAEFWQAGQDNLLEMDKRFDRQHILNEVEQNEHEILEHIAKLINQREISLWESFTEIDQDKVGFLNQDQFSLFLENLGIYLASNIQDKQEQKEVKQLQTQQLMKIIDPKSNGKVVHATSLEARLNQFDLNIQQESKIDQIEWKDKALTKMTVALQEHLGNDKTIVQYFSEFDKDYDGFLSAREMFEALRYMSSDYHLQDYQFNRIVQKIIKSQQQQGQQQSQQAPSISIQEIKPFFEKLISEVKQKQQNYNSKEDIYQSFILINKESFVSIVKNCDVFQSLFQNMGSLRKSFIQLVKRLKSQSFRGFQLASKQSAFIDIQEQIREVQQCLEHSIQSVGKSAANYIHNEVSVKNIDPAQNNFIIDQETLRIGNLELEQSAPQYISDTTQYHSESSTLEYLTPYLKKLSGEVVRTEALLDIFVYSKETLQQIGQDGNIFEKHLQQELKLHNCLSYKPGPYGDTLMFKNIGFYEKRIGIDTSDKEIYVINQAVDPNKYVSFQELIYNNGGILRVPFLTKTNAVSYLVKFWGRQILNIIQETHSLGCVLNILRPCNLYISMDGQNIKLNSTRGSGKMNRFSRHESSPDFKINLIPDHGPLKASLEQSFENHDQEMYQQYLETDPYLAPEQIDKTTLELTPYVDVWTFGCLMYEILFGKPPQSCNFKMKQFSKDALKDSEPSDYFYYDIYSDELVQEILKNDFNIVIDKKKQTMHSHMERAIGEKSFGGIFQDIFKDINENTANLNFQDLGQLLDIISCCLEYFPNKRPTIKGLINSPLFMQEEYEVVNSQEFSECMFFYKSPSVNIGERVFKPLRRLCAQTLDNSLDFYDQDIGHNIFKIIDTVRESVINQTSRSLENLQKNINISEKSQLFRLKTGMPLIMYDKLKQNEQARKKLSNNVLVKFIFDNDILDMLVFMVLRYHKYMSNLEVKLVQNTRLDKAQRNQQEFLDIREQSIRMLTALKDVFQQLIFQLDDYQSAIAPYVGKVIENLVKYFLGEEYKLASDIIDILNINAGFVPETNHYQEYVEQEQKQEKQHLYYKDFYDKFFQRNVDQGNQDEADKKWKETNPVCQRPYIFLSRNWSPVLYNVIGTLFKDTISEAGVGKGTYPVIQDYIRFCSEKQEINEFDINKKVDKLNQKIRRQLPRTADYYNDLIMMAENLSIIYDNKDLSNSSIRIVLSYFKSMLLSNNTDKIKLLLDSKAPVYLIPYLNTDNPHVRGELIDIFYEISNGFKQVQYSYIKKDTKKSDEINKNLGIVAHINKVSEDKIDRERFLDCANDYYYLKKQINRVYLYQMAFLFETPSLTQNLFYTIRSQAELIQNKIIMIRIFQNLVNAPHSIIRLLQSATVDVFSSVFRFLIKPKPGMPQNEMKINKILSPIVTEVFLEIQRESRAEIIDIMEQTPKIRVMLREQGFQVPRKLNLVILNNKIEALKEHYSQEKKHILLEIKAQIINSQQQDNQKMFNPNKTPSIQNFYYCLQDVCQHTLSWFKNYLLEDPDAQESAKKLCDNILNQGKYIIEDLYPYAQIHEGAEIIITEVIDFLEILINMDHYNIIFDQNNLKQASKNVIWIQDSINKISKYHENVGKQSDLEMQEKDRLKKSFISSLRDPMEREESQLQYVLDHESVRKFTQNKLNKISHSLMRILMKLTEINTEEMYAILNKAEFGHFFFNSLKKQYLLLQNFIRFKTEKIHVMQNYVEEANFRVKTFENILQGNNHELKEYLVNQGFISNICGHYLTNEKEFDVGQVRTSMKFLPFRDFLPFRNEALAMITAIIWHKENSTGVYKEVLLQISHYNLIKREYENINKHDQRSLIFLSALYFFTLLANSHDQQLIFLMKHERVNAFMQEFFLKNPEFIKYYPTLYEISNDGQGQFEIK